jgi:hypothetical protein
MRSNEDEKQTGVSRVSHRFVRDGCVRGVVFPEGRAQLEVTHHPNELRRG